MVHKRFLLFVLVLHCSVWKDIRNKRCDIAGCVYDRTVQGTWPNMQITVCSSGLIHSDAGDLQGVPLRHVQAQISLSVPNGTTRGMQYGERLAGVREYFSPPGIFFPSDIQTGIPKPSL